MKINYLTIYMVVVGWIGILPAMGMPLLLEADPELQRESAFYVQVWILGAIAALIAGGYILYDRRNDFGKVAALFVVVAAGSLLLALIHTIA